MIPPDDMFATISVDKFSFPSGHTTRAVFCAAYCITISHDPVFDFWVGAWAVIVAASRVLLGRHHVADVIMGAMVGLIVCELVEDVFWLDEFNAVVIQHFLSEHLTFFPFNVRI